MADNEALAAIIAGSGVDLVDAFFAVAAGMSALAVGGFAVQVTLALRSEEDEGRLEAVLATGVGARPWCRSRTSLPSRRRRRPPCRWSC